MFRKENLLLWGISEVFFMEVIFDVDFEGWEWMSYDFVWLTEVEKDSCFFIFVWLDRVRLV